MPPLPPGRAEPDLLPPSLRIPKEIGPAPIILPAPPRLIEKEKRRRGEKEKGAAKDTK